MQMFMPSGVSLSVVLLVAFGDAKELRDGAHAFLFALLS